MFCLRMLLWLLAGQPSPLASGAMPGQLSHQGSSGRAPASVLYGALSPKAFGQAMKLPGYADPPAAKRAAFKPNLAERV